MAGAVARVDPARDPRWDEFVRRHPEGRICGTARWLEVLRRAFGYEPVPLAYEEHGRLEGVLPLCLIRSALTGRRLVSLPFSGPAGPIGTSVEVVRALVASAKRLAAELGDRPLNIRSSSETAAVALQGFTRIQPFVSSLVPLDGDPRKLWRRIPGRSVRGEITRARHQGVAVRMGDSRDDLRNFYRLHIGTSLKHGIPPAPWRLFEAIWELFRPSGMVQLFVAELADRPITAQLCFAFGDVVSAGYVGTDYRFLSYHPVKLTDWTALEWACRRGFRTFDFLLSHVDNPGLRWYKRSFGAEEQPVVYYYHPHTDGVTRLREVLIGRRSRASGLVKAVVRRLPSTALILLGELSYPHVG